MSEQVVIVTGGAQGIGFACSRRFLSDGAKVVIADSDEQAGQKALVALEAYAEQVRFIATDVSDRLSVHNLIAEALSTYGRIDVLVNNAAIVVKGGILDLSDEDFDRVLSVNLRGAFLVAKAVTRYMVDEINNREDRSRLTERPYAIINMSSINDQVAIADQLAYTISKGGLRQMTRALALELAPYGIRVNAIGPGTVRTAMLESVLGDKVAEDKIYSRTPMGRMAQSDEIASVAAFLASEDASYITGETIYVDGGRLALNYTMPRPDNQSG